MYDDEEVINKIKEVYPHLKDVRFTLCDGILGWWYDSRYDVDINKLQLFVNDFLGQKVYRVKYTGYVDVYARNEEETKEYIKHLKPTFFRTDSPIETNEKEIVFIGK